MRNPSLKPDDEPWGPIRSKGDAVNRRPPRARIALAVLGSTHSPQEPPRDRSAPPAAARSIVPKFPGSWMLVQDEQPPSAGQIDRASDAASRQRRHPGASESVRHLADHVFPHRDVSTPLGSTARPRSLRARRSGHRPGRTRSERQKRAIDGSIALLRSGSAVSLPVLSLRSDSGQFDFGVVTLVTDSPWRGRRAD